MTETLVLPPRIDLARIGALAAAIRSGGTPPRQIDAGEVTHFGALGLQLLLAAAADARAQGRPLAVAPRSPAFDAAIADFGITVDLIEGRPA
jgi:chemotaxis protein CheX